MKHYPSIPAAARASAPFDAYLFDKLDGSNLRFAWEPKRGWHQYGTRTRLIDQGDPVFAPAIPLFHATLAEPIERIARAQRWQGLIVFAEFWGANSLAGQHDPADPKRLTLFDANPYKRGLLDPAAFLALFGDLEIPRFLGQERWDGDLAARVRRNEIPGVTFEGVVGKGGSGHHLVMAKAKTQQWIDRVLAFYGEERGRQIIDS